jgi:hypothetical protein
MGKRSNLPRRDRDFYPTPFVAVPPLVPHLRGSMRLTSASSTFLSRVRLPMNSNNKNDRAGGMPAKQGSEQPRGMNMPNLCDTNCTITGPDAEIEYFKQMCFIAAPTERDGDGIDFTRAEWKADLTIFVSTYSFHDGQHWLWIRSGWSPPVESLEQISALFPELTFEVSIADEFYNFAYKGSIKAGVADLHKDEKGDRRV